MNVTTELRNSEPIHCDLLLYIVRTPGMLDMYTYSTITLRFYACQVRLLWKTLHRLLVTRRYLALVSRTEAVIVFGIGDSVSILAWPLLAPVPQNTIVP